MPHFMEFAGRPTWVCIQSNLHHGQRQGCPADLLDFLLSECGNRGSKISAQSKRDGGKLQDVDETCICCLTQLKFPSGLPEFLQPIKHSKSHVLHASTTFFARPNEAGVFQDLNCYLPIMQRTKCEDSANASPACGFYSLSKDLPSYLTQPKPSSVNRRRPSPVLSDLNTSQGLILDCSLDNASAVLQASYHPNGGWRIGQSNHSLIIIKLPRKS